MCPSPGSLDGAPRGGGLALAVSGAARSGDGPGRAAAGPAREPPRMSRLGFAAAAATAPQSRGTGRGRREAKPPLGASSPAAPAQGSPGRGAAAAPAAGNAGPEGAGPGGPSARAAGPRWARAGRCRGLPRLMAGASLLRLVGAPAQPWLTQQPSPRSPGEQAAGLPPLQSSRAGSGGSSACRRGL